MTSLVTNSPPSSDPLDREPAIERQLTQAWRKERAVAHARGLATSVIALVAMLLAMLLLDWLLLLPGAVRLLLLLACLGGLGWIAYQHWWRRVQPFDRLRTALRVERKHPHLSSVLVSYVEMEHGADTYSPMLVRAMRREAVTQSESLVFTDIVETAVARRMATWAGVGVLVLVILAAIVPSVMSAFFVRMSNPFATVSYPTRTRIDSVTGDLTVAAGSSLRIIAETSGVTPPEGTIRLRAAGGAWDEVRLAAGDSADEFSYEIASVIDSFEYYIRLGDASSATYRVTVVPAPIPRSIEVAIAPPDYTGQSERIVDGLNFQAVRGSTVSWRLTFDRPLTSAQLLPDGEAPAQDLVLTDEGKVVTHRLTADESLAYRLRWTEREHGFAFDDGVRYRMQVVPDQSPVVTLTRPRDDTPGTLRKSIDVAFSANDDFGLRDAAIVYQINDGEEQRKPLDPFDAVQGDRRFTWRPADDIPQLREGDVLAWSIVVSDNGRDADGRPNTGRSAPRRLFVMSEPEYLAWIAERKSEMFGTLQDIRGSQVEASDEIETLRTLTTAPATPGGETQP